MTTDPTDSLKIEAISAFLGAFFAFVGAGILLWRSLAHERQQREADSLAERKRREASELAEFRSALLRIAKQLDYNRRLIRQIDRGAGYLPLHTEAMREVFQRTFPENVDYVLTEALFAIERYNAKLQKSKVAPDELHIAESVLESTSRSFSTYTQVHGLDWKPVNLTWPVPKDRSQ